MELYDDYSENNNIDRIIDKYIKNMDKKLFD